MGKLRQPTDPLLEAVPVLLKLGALSFRPSMPETGDKVGLSIKKDDSLASVEVK